MTLTITFLGSGSAFTVGANNYHSNILLQKGNDSLLIDAGGDLRFSLNEKKLDYRDIKNVYISHLHADHVGGLEWLALTTFFDQNYKGKPNLFCAENIIKDLWDKSLSGGLSTLSTELATLETFFNPFPLALHESFSWQGIHFKLVQAIHVVSDFSLMPCYGLLINYQGVHIYFTGDTQLAPQQLTDYYQVADVIFHDCETSLVKSGVHAHYSELVLVPQELKKKMWLYDYNAGPLPNAVADGFLGFVKKGQVFNMG